MSTNISNLRTVEKNNFRKEQGYQVYIERLDLTSIKQGYSGWPKVNIKNRNIKAMIVCVRTSSSIIAEMSDIV